MAASGIAIGRRWQRRVLWFAATILLAALARIFVLEPGVVPTRSMEGTILAGDFVLLNKAGYGGRVPLTGWRLPRLAAPKRGDIVAFRFPGNEAQSWLKRVVAVGGDTVEVCGESVYINGRGLEQRYPAGGRTASVVGRSTVVPAGQVFVLGDNREHSSDSREWGTVPLENISGKAVLVFWSYQAPSAALLDERPTARLRLYAGMAAEGFAHARWWRAGLLL